MLERIFTLKSDDMKLYVARHGETNLNIDDRYQGASDISLNQRGIDQARLLAEALPKEVIHVVSSPQRRALETALAIVKIRQLPLTLAPEFRERNFGVLEGLTQSEAQMYYPTLWGREILKQWDDAPPGAETISEVVKRVSEGLHRIRSGDLRGPVVIVTHGFIARIIQHILNSIPKSDVFGLQRVRNGEYVSYDLLLDTDY